MTADREAATASAGRLPVGIVGLIVVAWLGCYVPWTRWTGGAAFSSNVYDLAEWMSLTPMARNAHPPLVAPFLLRLTPGLVAIALSVSAAWLGSKWSRWTVRGLALGIAFGLMPPFDFFRGQFDDANYRQQFILSAVACGIVLVTWRWPKWWMGVLATAGALLSGVAGLLLSLNALAALKLNVTPGVGALIAWGALVIALFLMVRARSVRGALAAV